MVREIDQSKGRISRADAHYLLQRPWLTTPERRQRLKEMLETAPEKKAPAPKKTEEPTEE